MNCGAKLNKRKRCCPCCVGGDPCPPANLRCCQLPFDAVANPPKRKAKRPAGPDRMKAKQARIAARRSAAVERGERT